MRHRSGVFKAIRFKSQKIFSLLVSIFRLFLSKPPGIIDELCIFLYTEWEDVAYFSYKLFPHFDLWKNRQKTPAV